MEYYSFISLTIHLSILRSHRYHVDRATNPENMSNLAVNKEWASTRLTRACGESAAVSLSLSDTHTHTLTCSTYRVHPVRLLCGREAWQMDSRHSCPLQSVGHRLLLSKLTPQCWQRTIQVFACLWTLTCLVSKDGSFRRTCEKNKVVSICFGYSCSLPQRGQNHLLTLYEVMEPLTCLLDLASDHGSLPL